MNRRTLLRNCGVGLGVLANAALAGCTDSNNGDDGNGDDGDDENGDDSADDGGGDDAGDSDGGSNGDGDGSDGESGDDGSTDGAMGDIPTDSDAADETTVQSDSSGGSGGSQEGSGESLVEGLVIDGLERVDQDDRVSVATTVRNDGEQTTDIFEYAYELTLFDEAGTDVTDGGTNFGTTAETEIASGDTATINVSSTPASSVDDVASYEVTLSCEGPFVEGTYCDA